MFVSFEKQISRAVLEALDAAKIPHWIDYDHGYEPSGATSEDSIDKRLEELFACDEGWIMTGTTDSDTPADSFIYFIWGNGNHGLDCISDYGTSLQAVLDPILKAIDDQQ